MFLRIFAWLLSFLSILAFWNGGRQPNRIPEARRAPAASDHGIWPTEEFAQGCEPWWFSERAVRRLYDRKGEWDGGGVTDSLSVLYRGELIYQWHADGFDETTQFPVFSVTKSVTATLAGIAIYEGYIESLNQAVIEFFPEAEDLIAPNSNKRSLTVDHLLTMTSGIDYVGDWRSADDVGLAAFLQPQQYAPGRRFIYSADYEVLAAVLVRATGQSLYDFAQEYLFDPLGIESVLWSGFDDGSYRGGSGIRMNTQDMLRLGYLWLNYGQWEDAQLLCRDFMAQAPSRSRASRAYGRSFWNDDAFPFFLTGAYRAAGWNGQFITVYPTAGVVVVRTGWYENRTIENEHF